MADNKYCYTNSDVLINKLNITNQKDLTDAEIELTSIRLQELQKNPLKGKFDFAYLKEIHQYIFQDLYEWAGKERTVEIGKGNLFCTTPCIQDYADSVFAKYYPQCYDAKDNFKDFIRVLADNYGDLNALHPFREGNGRAQREFARNVCLACGYDFNLSCATHHEMLDASKLSFDKGDSSGFVKIFSKAVIKHGNNTYMGQDLAILTSDDLSMGFTDSYEYYEYEQHFDAGLYNKLYEAKIQKMEAERVISDAKSYLLQNKYKEQTILYDLDELER